MVKKIKKRSRKEKAKSTKLQANLQFAKASLWETEIIFEECLAEFSKRFNPASESPNDEDGNTSLEASKEEESPPAQEEDNSHQEEGEESEETEESEEDRVPEDEDIKAIFKKIALETHPDRLRDVEPDEVERLTELYKSAAEAARVGDGGELLIIALDLKIEIDIDIEKESLWIAEKIKKLHAKTLAITQSDAWVWHHAEGDRREKIEKFINERGRA